MTNHEPTLIEYLKDMGLEFTEIMGPEPDLSSVIDDDRFVDNPLEWNGFIKDRKRLLVATGFLTLWIQEWLDGSRDEPLTKFMADTYGFPCMEHPMGGEIDSGVYIYPEDPPLFPICKVEVGMPEPLYIYQHAIIAFPQEDGTYLTVRMD